MDAKPFPRPDHLIFLKLGGSLITEKERPLIARTELLARLASEIAAALARAPELRLLLGHGSGSFGHVPASQYGTRQGVRTPEGWRGFVEVWRAASALNRLVMDALSQVGLAVISLPPSASVIASGGQVARWDLGPVQAALDAGLLPVVFGDVIFDGQWGGTIFSTEDLFAYLARKLRPDRLLLAGLEPGVWADYPACTRLIPEIYPAMLPQFASSIGGSAATDVTGGMAGKVGEMLALVKEIPDLEVQIFSGLEPGIVEQVLLGAKVGTSILRGIR